MSKSTVKLIVVSFNKPVHTVNYSMFLMYEFIVLSSDTFEVIEIYVRAAAAFTCRSSTWKIEISSQELVRGCLW